MGNPVSKRKTRRTPAGDKKIGAKKSAQSLLVEILTEELPPKSLTRLSDAFSENIFNGLKESGFLVLESSPQPYATPRRLAVLITNVLDKQPDRIVERKGPAVTSAWDANGQPTSALLGFAKSCGVDVAKLERQMGDKGEYFVYRVKQKGEPLKNHLAVIVETALKKLPTPKLMRWGVGDAQFVRPVHGVILLHGKKVVLGTVLGLKSGNKTRGHRFLSRGLLTITHAKDYEKILQQQGKVYASFEARQESISKALNSIAKRLGAVLVGHNNISSEEPLRFSEADRVATSSLLDDVTALTEYPSVYEGEFDPTFLEVPRECLIISMQQHQKYFPLDSKQGRLLPKFLFVSNMKTATPKDIIHGNERVLRARLSDARFFFDQDRKTKLETRVPRLAHVVYHNKLGSQLERVQRIQKLAGEIARQIHAGYVAAAERAAYLCKADLVTDMVGEFPELQGTMGYYYALHDGEDLHVADAIRQHYRPRYAGDALPLSTTDISVALADKLDTLVGIYGIGLVPTGDKDPFGLRRLALGVVRILVERTETLTQKNREQLDQPLHVRMREEPAPMLQPLDVLKLLQLAHSQFPNGVVADSVAEDLHAFMLERLKPYLRDKGFESDEIDAVLSLNLSYLDQVVPRLQALQAFRVLPEAKTLAAANKRIGNILRQAGGNPADYEKSNPELFEHFAEKSLGEAVLSLHNEVIQTFGAGDYTDGLKRLARLGPYVDKFFDEVMVMADDVPVRNNRLALLNELRDLFLWVADISKLQS